MRHMEFDYILDYNADIETYKRSRERILKSDMEPTRKAALIANCDYAITWLETGRRPGNKRGVERLAAYQREIPIELIDKYAAPAKPAEIGSYDLQAWQHAEYILSLLTDRERECYELSTGHMYTEREIAEILGIHRSSVQQFLLRAKNKIRKHKAQPIPMLLDVVV